ncbi:hypothetical protein [Micropruina sp.]|uniref:hypothetical protein n=1 Tax=Micropruina sp. TaxID=2737536 RepID=UPI0039E26250
MLREAEQLEMINADSVVDVTKADQEELVQSRDQRRSLTEELRDEDISRSRRWRQAGLAERYVVWHLGRWRFVGYMFGAGLDAYIFAKAYGYAEATVRGLDGDLALGIGAGIGLLVFFVGFILARMMKSQVMYAAQRKLLKDRGLLGAKSPLGGAKSAVDIESDNSPLVAGRIGWMIPLVLWAIFLGLSYAGLTIRTAYAFARAASGGATDGLAMNLVQSLHWLSWYAPAQFGILILQTLIPLIVVALEVVIFDPLEPSKVLWLQPGPLSAWREARAKRRSARLAASEKGVKDAIRSRYVFEAEALRAIHDE